MKRLYVCIFLLFPLQSFSMVPGQNLWGLYQQTASSVEVMSETFSLFDTVFNSQIDLLNSFIDTACDTTSIMEEILAIASVVEKIDTDFKPFNPSVLDITLSVWEELAMQAADLAQTVSLLGADISVLDGVLQAHDASTTAQLMGISGQVSVLDSKVDKLSSSVFPVLSTLATAAQVSVVDSKVDKLSNSLFDVLATVATAQGVATLATGAQVSVLDSKVDQLSNSVFPVLATLATASVITPLATALAVSVLDSKVDTLSNSLFPVLATILADVSFPTPITTSMTITTSGNYQLAKNILGTITIDADAVTLDLNGFTLNPNGGTGVSIATNHKYITVKNGFIAGNGLGIFVDTGNKDFVITDIEIADALSGGMSLVATNTFSSTIQNFIIKNCTVSSNSSPAYSFVSCINGVVRGCISEQSAAEGFSLSLCVNMLLEDCFVIRSSAAGFFPSSVIDCVLNRCVALSGTTQGFELFSTTDCVVMSCVAANNGTGFSVTGSNNICTNNLATKNTTNYSTVTNAPLTSSTDATMNFWKNYQG